MSCRCIHLRVFLLFFLFPLLSSAQPLYEPGLVSYWRFGHREAYAPGSGFHTSLRPYFYPQLGVVANLDSLYAAQHVQLSGDGLSRWMGERLLNHSLLEVDAGHFKMWGNLLFDFGVGRETIGDEPTWVNTRGFLIEGTVGDKIGFSSRFFENQGRFPGWIRDFVGNYRVLPGQGATRRFKEDAYDYSRAEGYLSYSPSEYFNFQLGHGRHFIGDGYRSLLLSDNAFPYPYLKGTITIWRLKYMMLYTEMQNRRPLLGQWPQEWHSFYGGNLMGNPRKHMTLHYLSVNVGERFSFGLFEGVIWSRETPDGYRGFDLNYINPLVFFRPVEFSVGSPDKMIVGANASFKAGKGYVLYGQFVLDEFKLEHLRARNGWHSNKFGYQLGIKAYDAFAIPQLFLLAEYNRVRPFTYSHWQPLTQYSHYNQPLAHPLGANFHETNLQASYRYRRWYASYAFSAAIKGFDEPGTNYGGNIFNSYWDHTLEFGNTVGQGVTTTRHQHDVQLSWLMQPKTNMNISVGASMRREQTDSGQQNWRWMWVAFRTSLDRYFYDF